VYTTVSTDEKARQALELGADHAINYKTDRFEGRLRKLTKKQGVDVVFEHVGVDTWEGSMFSLKIGGRLVTCGSTSGIKAEINLFQLFRGNCASSAASVVPCEILKPRCRSWQRCGQTGYRPRNSAGPDQQGASGWRTAVFGRCCLDESGNSD
jgi:NADPH:quinone reductase-like Zn-dependent oxidoreductase